MHRSSSGGIELWRGSVIGPRIDEAICPPSPYPLARGGDNGRGEVHVGGGREEGEWGDEDSLDLLLVVIRSLCVSVSVKR